MLSSLRQNGPCRLIATIVPRRDLAALQSSWSHRGKALHHGPVTVDPDHRAVVRWRRIPWLPVRLLRRRSLWRRVRTDPAAAGPVPALWLSGLLGPLLTPLHTPR